MASLLNMFDEDVSFTALQVHLATRSQLEELPSQIGSYSAVLSFPLGDHFGVLERSRMLSYCPKTIFMTNVHFEGLHPDFTFIGAMEDRCTGILGNYHSRIAFHSFLAGKTVLETAKFFSRHSYRTLKYIEWYQRSKEIFYRRDADNEIRFSDLFFTIVERERALLTFNHPTAATFINYVSLIIKYLSFLDICKSVNVPTDFSIHMNSLLSGPVLPVYPEISDELGLAIRDDYLFKSASTAKHPGRFIDLRAFIEDEFECFSKRSHEWLAETPQYSVQERSRFADMLCYGR